MTQSGKFSDREGEKVYNFPQERKGLPKVHGFIQITRLQKTKIFSWFPFSTPQITQLTNTKGLNSTVCLRSTRPKRIQTSTCVLKIHRLGIPVKDITGTVRVRSLMDWT